MGSAELIENGFVSEKDMPRFVGRIRSEAARLVTLIEDIIRLSQLDEGADMPIETFDLMQIVRDNAETLQGAADEAGVTLSAYGESVKMTAASTDCNIPHSLGIPAAAMGICKWNGIHTREEWIEKDSLIPGLEIALRVICALTEKEV
jgi:signal transduction histidine kinase